MGVDGARPGVMMPGTFLLGSRYFQELAPDVALDQAEHIAMGLTVKTPARTFANCVKILETTPLEPDDISTKVYCPGIGLILDDSVTLVEINRVKRRRQR